MSDLILDLESKFSRIKNKLDEKVSQINNFYAKNVNKLNDTFNVEAATERYSAGLNNQRDVLLNEEIEQRNSELSKAKELLDSNINPLSQINEFKRLEFIKSKKSFKTLFVKELKFRLNFDFVELFKYRYLLKLDKYIDEQSTSLNASSKSCPQTPLVKALYDGNLEIAQLLIESGADVNAVGIKNEAFLKLDAILGRNGPAALRIALERGNLGLAKFIQLHLSLGNTALIKASHEGYLKIAELLIENGADVNMKNIRSETALASSLNKANLEIAKLLINNGADVNYKNLLIKAVIAENCDIVKLLIESGVNLTAKNGLSGETALTEAVTKDNLDMAKLLAESGADLNARNNNGDSALIKAALLGLFDIAKLLIESGADVNIKNKDGNTT
jgi:ankyrin repeat protein